MSNDALGLTNKVVALATYTTGIGHMGAGAYSHTALILQGQIYDASSPAVLRSPESFRPATEADIAAQEERARAALQHKADKSRDSRAF